MFTLWLVCMVLCWILGGLAIHTFIKEEGEDFKIKHLIACVLGTLFVSALPIINAAFAVLGIVVAVGYVVESFDDKAWFNQPVVKKTK